MNTFYRRIVILFLFIIISLSILIGRLLDIQYTEANAEKQLQQLKEQTTIIEMQLEGQEVDEAASLLDQITPVAQSIPTRVTLFDQQGQLVYDSLEGDYFPATSEEIKALEENKLIESRKSIDNGESKNRIIKISKY